MLYPLFLRVPSLANNKDDEPKHYQAPSHVTRFTEVTAQTQEQAYQKEAQREYRTGCRLTMCATE